MDHIWEGLLLLKKTITERKATVDYCWIDYLENSVSFDRPAANKKGIILILFKHNPQLSADYDSFLLCPPFRFKKIQQKYLTKEETLFLEKYLPYCLLSTRAHHLKRAISVCHFAQTLDGKISTETGDSKWIGNEENLIHSHRMRALCDGILVGARTVEADSPQLTVRKVKGKNPVKIILGTPKCDLASLLISKPNKVFVLGTQTQNFSPPIEFIQLNSNGIDKKIPPKTILQKLYELGIYSVYIEGGTVTTSHFLQVNQVDILQLHIAPLLFGSGKAGISLPSIEMVKDARTFEEFQFLPVGDSMMFTGFNNNNN